jgi:hypothetical protein
MPLGPGGLEIQVRRVAAQLLTASLGFTRLGLSQAQLLLQWVLICVSCCCRLRCVPVLVLLQF